MSRKHITITCAEARFIASVLMRVEDSVDLCESLDVRRDIRDADRATALARRLRAAIRKAT